MVQAVDEVDLCLFKAMGKPESSPGAAFCALHFCRIHGSLRVTQAMEAEVADHAWDLSELLA